MSDCIFCKMANGEIPVEFVYRDEDVLVIRDINPQAPTHFLVIPTQHIASSVEVADPSVWNKVLGRAVELARQLGQIGRAHV